MIQLYYISRYSSVFKKRSSVVYKVGPSQSMKVYLLTFDLFILNLKQPRMLLSHEGFGCVVSMPTDFVLHK